MSDILKSIQDLTGLITTASEKVEEANKKSLSNEEKSVAVDGEVKSLVEKLGKHAEAHQELVLKQAESDKRSEALEKAISRVGNGGEGDDSLSQEEKTYHKSLNSYLRRGDRFAPTDEACEAAVKHFVARTIGTDDDEMVTAAVKTMQAGVGADGGFLILPDRRAGITDVREFETSPIRALANVVTTSSDEYEIVADDDESASGGWVGEVTNRPNTDTAKTFLIKIPLHEQYAQPKVTQKFLDDASINVEQFVATKTNDILTRTENTSFVTGDGSSKPRGFLTLDAWASAGTYQRDALEQINSGTSGEVEYDGLIEMQGSLKGDYQGNAAFTMQRATWTQVLLLKDGESRPLLRPDLLLNGAELRLLGKRVIFADDMAEVAADALAIAYGDFGKGYTIVDRMGIRTLRDPYTEKPFVKFYTTKRVGADVTNYEAIKLMKLSA